MKRGPGINIENLQDQIKIKRIAPITSHDFIHACEYGNLEEVKEGLQSLSADVIVSFRNGALHQAARNAHLSVVKHLLDVDEVRRTFKIELQEEVQIYRPSISWAKKITFSNNDIEPIETVIKWLTEQYPQLKLSIEKEQRKNEARALYFAFKAAKSKPSCSQSVFKKYGQRDTVVKIMQMILNSPPPAQRFEEPLTKKLR